jgi:hypothetical protein
VNPLLADRAGGLAAAGRQNATGPPGMTSPLTSIWVTDIAGVGGPAVAPSSVVPAGGARPAWAVRGAMTVSLKWS